MHGQTNTPETGPVDLMPGALRVSCERCNTGILHPDLISTAFWQDDGLVVVRNIPALVCPDCGEQYIDDRTVVRLDHLRGRDFAGLPAIDEVIVPILDFGGTG